VAPGTPGEACHAPDELRFAVRPALDGISKLFARPGLAPGPSRQWRTSLDRHGSCPTRALQPTTWRTLTRKPVAMPRPHVSDTRTPSPATSAVVSNLLPHMNTFPRRESTDASTSR
jgi:hypothetical protein